MSKPILFLVGFIGVLFIIAAGIYIFEPARNLPQFFPGYNSSLMRHHYTHGVAALVLGLLAFSFIWFKSGKTADKSTSEKSSEQKVN